MERVENPKQVSHSPHRPLEISPTPRDSHIPTARLRPGWKRGKPETGSPLSHAGLATTITFSIQPTKTQKGAWPGTPVHTLRFHAHSALEPNRTFMLILRLENAPFRSSKVSSGLRRRKTVCTSGVRKCRRISSRITKRLRKTIALKSRAPSVGESAARPAAYPER